MSWLTLVGTAWAGTAIVPIVAALTILVGSLQAAGGSFIALKCCWLGITWRRGSEHGMDEFTAVGISAALILGSTAIGAAIAGAAGSPLTPSVAGYGPLNEIAGDVLGALSYLMFIISPALVWLRRLEQKHAQMRRFWHFITKRV